MGESWKGAFKSSDCHIWPLSDVCTVCYIWFYNCPCGPESIGWMWDYQQEGIDDLDYLYMNIVELNKPVNV